MIVAQTSLEAYYNLKAEGKDRKQYGQILLTMIETGQADYTRQELRQLTGLTINALCGRVREMLDKGWVRENGSRICEATGNRVKALALVIYSGQPGEQYEMFL